MLVSNNVLTCYFTRVGIGMDDKIRADHRAPCRMILADTKPVHGEAHRGEFSRTWEKLTVLLGPSVPFCSICEQLSSGRDCWRASMGRVIWPDWGVVAGRPSNQLRAAVQRGSRGCCRRDGMLSAGRPARLYVS